MGKVKIPNGVEAYAIIMSQYVQEYVNNVEKYLYERGLVLFKKVSTPLLKKYSPEVDGIPELYEREASYHQSCFLISSSYISGYDGSNTLWAL